MLKHYYYFILIFLLISCNSFYKPSLDKVEAEKLVKFYLENKVDELSKSDSSQYSEKLKNLGFDYFILSNKLLQGKNVYTFLEFDSLAIFVIESHNIFDTEKRYVFDYANKPRNFGNLELPNAAYEREQIHERWYFETEGFD